MQNMKKNNNFLYFFLFLMPGFLSGQQVLKLENCSVQEFAINDHSDSDDDGVVCEAKILLTNSAYYENGNNCQLSDIKWTVTIDLFNDGVIDVEYSSSLPEDDDTLDDTNGNGIPDLYIPMTTNNEAQEIQLPDIEGASSDHKVTWKVSDDCDLGDLCITNFSVADKKAPTPFCVSLSTVIFDGVNTTEIFAEDFNVGVFDNCTDHENIRISFSDESIVPSRIMTCEDVLNSPLMIQVYFWDESDNIDLCTVFLTVKPEGAGYDCLPEREVHGVVRDCNNNPMEGVEVRLDSNLPEYPRYAITDEEGKYSIGPVPYNINYNLSAKFDDSYLNNVSTLDLVKIVRHLLEIQSFTNPYKIIASDITGDYHVKVQDVVILRKLILGVISEFPDVPSWRFINADFEFEDELDPFSTVLSSNENPFVIEFKNADLEGYDFIGIKVGNVN